MATDCCILPISGGMAALTHADRLYNLLPKSVKKVQVVVDGAMFVDVPSVSGYNIIAETFQSVYKVHNLKSSLSAQRCIQNQTPETEWRCLLPEVFSSYVITPAFFINSVYDTWQCAHSLKVPCFSTCLDCNTDALYTMRDAIRHLASQIVKSRKNKVFLTWCPLHIIITKPWIFELIGHPTLQISLASWLQEDMTQNNVDIVLSLESAHKHCGTILNYS
uniref:Uncharacterized protein n=1 Tax=Arion vulgaris TaxID=1028688 RepID=A0A0B6Z3E9_9EUPU